MSKKEKLLQISSVPQFINDLWKTHESAFFFRGQPKNWPLIPSIARNKKLLAGYEDWQSFQKGVLQEYSKYAVLHLTEKPSNDLDWLIQAQHYGLPTCLLDLTNSPLIALFYAVTQEQYDSVDGVVWAISPSSHYEDYIETRNFDTNSFRFLRPRQAHPRIIAQQAAFAVFPLPKSHKKISSLDQSSEISKEIDRIQKWTVPAKIKPELRLQLALLGIRPRTVFPDIYGAAEDIKFQLKTGGWIR